VTNALRNRSTQPTPVSGRRATHTHAFDKDQGQQITGSWAARRASDATQGATITSVPQRRSSAPVSAQCNSTSDRCSRLGVRLARRTSTAKAVLAQWTVRCAETIPGTAAVAASTAARDSGSTRTARSFAHDACSSESFSAPVRSEARTSSHHQSRSVERSFSRPPESTASASPPLTACAAERRRSKAKGADATCDGQLAGGPGNRRQQRR